MADASHETHLAELLAKGMASEEEVAEARRLLAEAAARGAELSVAEALVRAGVMAARAHHAAPIVAAVDAATAAAEDTAAAAMPSSDLQVLEKLGRGSQAVVFKCRQISMDRIVAAKILLARSARDPEARERFIREARQAANLAHPNIVTIHQILPFAARSSSGDQALDSFCIVMEYIDGGTVADLLAARKRFDPAEAACIIRPVAEALAFAHKRGIIHRDIKPGNILLTAGGLVKLADLGLALPLTDAQQAGQGRAYGTPYYISPEQVRGDADIDFRADLYSLAATFYEMVAGVPPFTAATPQEVMRKHLSEPVPDPRKHVPELSKALCWMLARALAKDRAYRYESAEDFIAALEKVFPTVDAAVAGASGAAGAEPAAARAAADPTVPAAKALVEQLAGASEAERRRAGRAQIPAGKAAGKTGAPARAAEVKHGRGVAVEAARDPKRLRKRNMILVGVFGGLVVAGIVAAVLLFVLYPPVQEDAPPPKFAPKFVGAPDAGAPAAPEAPLPPAAPAPAVAPPVVSAPDVSKPSAAESNPEVTPGARPAPPAPPKEEKPVEATVARVPEPPPEPPKPPAPAPAPAKEDKPPESPPGQAGVITLKADDAKIHGKNAAYEKADKPGAAYRDNIGLWFKTDTFVAWDVTIVQAGTYEVEVAYALLRGAGGEYALEIAGQTAKCKPAATAGWHDFKTVKLGKVRIAKAGPVTVTVKPLSIKTALMNLQAVTLKRTGP